MNKRSNKYVFIFYTKLKLKFSKEKVGCRLTRTFTHTHYIIILFMSHELKKVTYFVLRFYKFVTLCATN